MTGIGHAYRGRPVRGYSNSATSRAATRSGAVATSRWAPPPSPDHRPAAVPRLGGCSVVGGRELDVAGAVVRPVRRHRDGDVVEVGRQLVPLGPDGGTQALVGQQLVQGAGTPPRRPVGDAVRRGPAPRPGARISSSASVAPVRAGTSASTQTTRRAPTARATAGRVTPAPEKPEDGVRRPGRRSGVPPALRPPGGRRAPSPAGPAAPRRGRVGAARRPAAGARRGPAAAGGRAASGPCAQSAERARTLVPVLPPPGTPGTDLPVRSALPALADALAGRAHGGPPA